MALNSLGREIPESYAGRKLTGYRDPYSLAAIGMAATRPLRRVNPGGGKLLGSLAEAIEASGLRDGMTISTHHALRNGDFLLNAVVAEIARIGLRGIWIASSSVHPVHAEIIPHIRSGVIAGFQCGVNGLIGELASRGELSCPIVVRSHGGRARALMEGSGYGWVASPFPTGTFTLQDTPSFAWRDNSLR